MHICKWSNVEWPLVKASNASSMHPYGLFSYGTFIDIFFSKTAIKTNGVQIDKISNRVALSVVVKRYRRYEQSKGLVRQSLSSKLTCGTRLLNSCYMWHLLSQNVKIWHFLSRNDKTRHFLSKISLFCVMSWLRILCHSNQWKNSRYIRVGGLAKISGYTYLMEDHWHKKPF